MEGLKKLLKDHEKLKKLSPNTEGFEEILRKHFEEEEKFFSQFKDKLGGDDELSPLGMVKSEHQLLLEYLKKGDLKGFENLLKYHLKKEETQIFTLLE
jgi:hemerythrin-like domain-containing protein